MGIKMSKTFIDLMCCFVVLTERRIELIELRCVLLIMIDNSFGTSVDLVVNFVSTFIVFDIVLVFFAETIEIFTDLFIVSVGLCCWHEMYVKAL
jgi:hypothetical protein